MRDRSRGVATKSRIRLRSSHHRVAPLRISHRRSSAGWVPPHKDGDDEDDRNDPDRRKR